MSLSNTPTLSIQCKFNIVAIPKPAAFLWLTRSQLSMAKAGIFSGKEYLCFTHSLTISLWQAVDQDDFSATVKLQRSGQTVSRLQFEDVCKLSSS